MSDIIPLVAIISLIGNAVLMIAYAAEYNRRRQAETQAYLCVKDKRQLAKAFAIAQRNSVRRDPKTGRYLKNRSN